MRPALEDLLMGQVASPSFPNDLRFRWEDSRRRVRTIFDGVTITDSIHVMLLHEAGRLPVFYFPIEDVRMDMMQATVHSTNLARGCLRNLGSDPGTAPLPTSFS